MHLKSNKFNSNNQHIRKGFSNLSLATINYLLSSISYAGLCKPTSLVPGIHQRNRRVPGNALENAVLGAGM